MKTFAAALAALAVFAAQPAVALEQSASVKVTKLLQSPTSWNGAALAYPGGQAEVTAMLIEIAPGAETGWHLHPVASFAYILEGELEVSLKDGSVKRLAQKVCGIGAIQAETTCVMLVNCGETVVVVLERPLESQRAKLRTVVGWLWSQFVQRRHSSHRPSQ